MHAALLLEEYARWFASFSWDTFATFTFTRRRTVRRAGELFVAFATSGTGSEIDACLWGAEPHPGGHGGHVHALIKWHPWVSTVDQVFECTRAWRGRFGQHCRLVEYDPYRGAAWYLGKYVLKEAAESGTWGFITRGGEVDADSLGEWSVHREPSDSEDESFDRWQTQKEIEARLDREEEVNAVAREEEARRGW